MKSIVITGSSRGIGFGLADEFLVRGCSVVVSGSNQASTDKAVAELSEKHGNEHLLGQACDVCVYEQTQALWDAAVARFGKVDVWINNSGIAHPFNMFWELTPDRIETVVKTNLTGLLYCSKIAMQGMIEQGHGQIYNMEGHGSNGSLRNGQSIYGTTKAGLYYFTRALIKEAQNTPVQVGSLRPGMVITDMVMDEVKHLEKQEQEKLKRIFNIIADRVETVVPYLVEKILENNKSGARILWLTRRKLIWRFVTSPFRKRDLFSDQTE